MLFLPARAALSLPLPVLGAMSVYCALLGESLRLHGMYDTFRIAAIGNAPYIVTVTAGGAAKRVGLPGGFSNSARANDPYSRWQSVLLPVFLAAAVVFGVLSTLETKQNALLAWNLSVMLASANLLAFPMVCALPLKRIAARLAKSGSAVAGFFRRGRHPPEQLRHPDRWRPVPARNGHARRAQGFRRGERQGHLLRRDDGPRVRKRTEPPF